MTNKEVHEQIGRLVSSMTIIKSRKLFEHVTRMHDGRLMKMVTFGMVEGRRPREDFQGDGWTTSRIDVRWICARLRRWHRIGMYGRSSRLAPTVNWLWDKEEEDCFKNDIYNASSDSSRRRTKSPCMVTA